MEIKQEELIVRESKVEDCDLIVKLIKTHGEYEKADAKQLPVTAELIKTNIFQKKYGKIFIAEINYIPVGFCCFFLTFSTLIGKPGIWLEDLFVLPEYRKKGIGFKLIQRIANVCLENNYDRMDWTLMNWNHLAMEFYKKIGAKPIKELNQYRMEGDQIRELSDMKL